MKIATMAVIESVLKFMKAEPAFLLDYLEGASLENLRAFMNGLPYFYFDQRELGAYAHFLKALFTRKLDKGGFPDYNNNEVGNVDFRTSRPSSAPSFGSRTASPSHRASSKRSSEISEC